MSLEIAIEQGPDQRSGGAASPKILSVARIQMVYCVVVGNYTPMLVIDNLLMATATRWANFVRYNISFEKWSTVELSIRTNIKTEWLNYRRHFL